MTYEIEITRNNVTPAKFFAEIRFACKKKGIDFGLELEQFINPIQPGNHHYAVINGEKVCYAGNYRYVEPAESAPCEAEVCRDLPYDCQTFVRGFDGACYNEICEFTFDDEKTGHGYYYQMNKDATA